MKLVTTLVEDVHTLKTWPMYFQAIWDERKLFEVRVDDRGFQAKDTLHLCEYAPDLKIYTGRFMLATVEYVMMAADLGLLREGVVVMQLGNIRRFVGQGGRD